MKTTAFFLILFSTMLMSLPKSGATESQVSFIETPQQAFAARWDLIDQEKEEILADFNMWESTGAAGQTLAKLCLKARAGVPVRLVIDGFSANFWGVGGIDASLIKVVRDNCRSANSPGRDMFTIRYWNPVNMKHIFDYLKSSRLKRDHDKILFVKGQNTVYSGDRNWQDVNYRQSLNPGQTGYTYISIDTIATGAVAQDVEKYLEDVWENSTEVQPVLVVPNPKKSGKQRIEFNEYTQEKFVQVANDFLKLVGDLEANARPAAWAATSAMGVISDTQMDWHKLPRLKSEVRFVHFSPGIRLHEHTETESDLAFTNQLVDLIKSAKNTLVLSTPYLRLPDSLFNAIVDRRKAGVAVRMITSKADSKILPQEFQFQNKDIDRLKKIGVEILQKDSTDDLHAKLIVADNERAFIGSNNLNMRATYMDLEAGFIFNDPKVAKIVGDFANDDLAPYKRKKTNAVTWIVERLLGFSSLLQKQL